MLRGTHFGVLVQVLFWGPHEGAVKGAGDGVGVRAIVCSTDRVSLEQVCLPFGRLVCSAEQVHLSACTCNLASICAVLRRYT